MAADRLALLSGVVLCAALPVAMVLANKSAPVSLILGALLAIVAAVAAGRRRVLLRRCLLLLEGTRARLLVAFTILCTVSLLWSIAPGMTVRGLSETLPELVFGAAAVAAWPLVAKPDHLRWLAIGIALATLLIAIEAIAGMPLHHLVHAREDPADLKRSSIPPLLLLWPALLFHLRRRDFKIATALALLVLLGGVVSHSSATVLAVLVGCTVLVLAMFAPKPATLGFALALLCQLAAAPWIGSITSRLFSPGIEASLAEQHVSQRERIWRIFQQEVWRRPLLGHGFDTSFRLADVARAERSEMGPMEIEMIAGIHPHNQLLQIWIDLGLVGACFTVAGLVVILRRLMRFGAQDLAPRLAFLSSAAIVALVGVQAWDAWWLATIAASQAAFVVLGPRETAQLAAESADVDDIGLVRPAASRPHASRQA